MAQEVIIPFTWEGWDMQDGLCNSYYQVKFIKDFGIFKKGECFEGVTVDYGEGVLQIDDYNDRRSQKFIAQPINE
jgi:hypothetical protein